jgi:hypothetical protein
MFRANHVAAFLPFVAAVAAALLSGAPASAQSNSIRQGVLTCQTSASVGLIVGSRQRLRCQFKSETGRTQNYVGTIGRLGLDLGVTAGGVMAWAVLASTANNPPARSPANLSGPAGTSPLAWA